jgi:acyl-CoA reductase-like NAD-dependent aldehyde dehydrogenase
MDMITPEPRPAWIAGRPEQGATTLVVYHPYDGSEVATVAVPGPEQVERAVAAAVSVAKELRRTAAHVRAGALDHVSRVLAGRAEEIAEVITAENGKPLKWAEAEVKRAVSVFRIAAEEARRFSGDVQRLDTDPAGEARLALTRRVPRGPVLGIAPFNFPLNLVAHKVAPALAVGAPIIVKPAPRTPLSALILGEILAETDLPEGAFSVLPLGNEDTAKLVADPRLPVVSFTGSGPVGWSLADAAPRKHVVLELGGNAAAVVLRDWPDPEGAAHRIATFGNYQAGQSCIAVQRVIVDAEIAGEFVPALAEAVQSQQTGDPYDRNTDVGPVVDEAAARADHRLGRRSRQSGREGTHGRHPRRRDRRPDPAHRRPAGSEGVGGRDLRPGTRGVHCGRRGRGVRGGQRLGVRTAGGRLHHRRAARLPRLGRARGGRRDHRRRPVVPGRPDALRRRQRLRRRA